MGYSCIIIWTPFSYNSVICRHIKREISLECRWVRAEDASFVSGVVVCCRCHWESRPQEGGGIAQDCLGLRLPGPRGAKVPRHQMVQWCAGVRSTRDDDTGNEDNGSFARFLKLDKYAMFSFAMTSGLASDSDKFKITITLLRAQKFGDTGPYKNFDFLYNPLVPEFFCNFS